jgi:DNA/RNA endonuclease YhcR with UshA esterase domain
MKLHYRLLLRELTQPSQWFSSSLSSTALQAQPFGSSHLVQHVRCFGTVVSLSLNMDEPVQAVIDDTTGTVHVKVPLALSKRLIQQDHLQLGSCVDVTGTVSLMPNTELKALQIDATS